MRDPADGGCGGPIVVLAPIDGRGLGAIDDGREVPLTDERDDGVAESCFVGDFVGDFEQITVSK